ncbi:hypothetical protein Acsp06_50560 [Actinomycetospora sp. NBRC 106375]|uniref:hypothetical protein n=1 Tax=Actinomycetospora sp. NBRC 106375 TaxID=3032207 RepID=UPI0024A26785|nr:hypothetical protein Acsp06_50560 [Actinomycetospora sp. NBRC 106375]
MASATPEWPTPDAVGHRVVHGGTRFRDPVVVDDGVPGARRIVTAHLGAGASLCAVVEGRSVDTTMGFTPLEGLVMATRSGTVDPGLVLWLSEHEGLSPHEVAETLEQHSGLLALAGTADLRAILERDDDDARLAVAVYVHRIAGGIAAMAASAGGIDALAFTGGVGENSGPIRAAVAERTAFLGVRIDPSANATTVDGDISAPGAPIRTLVVPAREDLEIARGVRAVIPPSRETR